MEESLLQQNTDNFNVSKNKNYFPKKSLFYIICLFLFFLILYFIFLSAPKNFPINTAVNIGKGESLRGISRDFKDKNIIRSRTFFEAFVIIYGGERHILIGDYLFENKLPVFEVARRVAQKERNLAPIKVTIPEGFNNEEIAIAFSSKLKNFDKVKFLAEAKISEGYLFPDTYFFFSEDNEKSVLDYMKSNFDKKIKTVESMIVASGKSKKDIITMAAIVEKEAKGDSDRGIIAGILWNRISKNMPLQVDADLWTYKNKGLPESPICNPGLEAITATIKPIKSSYLYYLHDENGGIHYAASFEEHKKNILRYLK